MTSDGSSNGTVVGLEDRVALAFAKQHHNDPRHIAESTGGDCGTERNGGEKHSRRSTKPASPPHGRQCPSQDGSGRREAGAHNRRIAATVEQGP
jgi:hypothetical protein